MEQASCSELTLSRSSLHILSGWKWSTPPAVERREIKHNNNEESNFKKIKLLTYIFKKNHPFHPILLNQSNFLAEVLKPPNSTVPPHQASRLHCSSADTSSKQAFEIPASNATTRKSASRLWKLSHWTRPLRSSQTSHSLADPPWKHTFLEKQMQADFHGKLAHFTAGRQINDFCLQSSSSSSQLSSEQPAGPDKYVVATRCLSQTKGDTSVHFWLWFYLKPDLHMTPWYKFLTTIRLKLWALISASYIRKCRDVSCWSDQDQKSTKNTCATSAWCCISFAHFKAKCPTFEGPFGFKWEKIQTDSSLGLRRTHTWSLVEVSRQLVSKSKRCLLYKIQDNTMSTGQGETEQQLSDALFKYF